MKKKITVGNVANVIAHVALPLFTGAWTAQALTSSMTGWLATAGLTAGLVIVFEIDLHEFASKVEY